MLPRYNVFSEGWNATAYFVKRRSVWGLPFLHSIRLKNLPICCSFAFLPFSPPTIQQTFRKMGKCSNKSKLLAFRIRQFLLNKLLVSTNTVNKVFVSWKRIVSCRSIDRVFVHWAEKFCWWKRPKVLPLSTNLFNWTLSNPHLLN